MGYITRRLTYQVDSRRVSLPTHFLSAHGLEPGVELRIAAAGDDTRLVLTGTQWGALETCARFTPPPSLGGLLASGAPVTLGTQGRVVLPRALAFEADTARLELSWELEGGVLVMARTDTPTPAARAFGAGARAGEAPGAMMPRAGGRLGAVGGGLEEERGGGLVGDRAGGLEVDAEGDDDAVVHGGGGARAGRGVEGAAADAPRTAPLPDGLVLPGPVKEIPLGAIHGIDPDLEPDSYDASLAEDIATQGMLRPVVLSGYVPYRIIDGRKRLKVAQALKMEQVPAVVMGTLSRDDIARLRYLLETTSDRWAVARQLRVLARLHLNGAPLDQLAGLLRKKRRTVQRYLRIAQDPQLVEQIERGEISLLEAERRAGGG